MGVFLGACQKLLRCRANIPRQCIFREITSLNGTVDRYNGVAVSVEKEVSLATSIQDFHNVLKESITRWKCEGRTAVWLHLPMHYSRYIDAASAEGFQFHNAENNHCLLKLWLSDRVDATPRFATHQIGVCGVVFREDTNEFLVMQERKSQFTAWKFPGGLSELGEDIGDAAVRETFEETGIRTEFASVIAFRQQHQHPGAFGRSDLYVVCRLRPLTFDIVPCDREVLKCQWMQIEVLRENIHISSITRRMTSLVSHGVVHGFDKIEYTAEEMKSVYKGMHFTLFHKNIDCI